MGERSSSSGGGIGLSTAIFLIFLTLKLLNIEPVASWSWIWVFSPLWIGFALIIFILVFAGSSIGIFSLFDKLSAGRKIKLKDEDD
jgi:hypothetical protein